MQSEAPVRYASAMTIVNSANDLFLALRTGARHIDLRDHIDISTRSIYEPVDWSEPLLPDVLRDTTSITVCFLSSSFPVHNGSHRFCSTTGAHQLHAGHIN